MLTLVTLAKPTPFKAATYHPDFDTAPSPDDAADTITLFSCDDVSFYFSRSILLEHCAFFRALIKSDPSQASKHTFKLDYAPTRGLALLLLGLRSKAIADEAPVWIARSHHAWKDRQAAFFEAVAIAKVYDVDWLHIHLAIFPGVWDAFTPVYIFAALGYDSSASDWAFRTLSTKWSKLSPDMDLLLQTDGYKAYRDLVEVHYQAAASARAVYRAMRPAKYPPIAGSFDRSCKRSAKYTYDGCSSYRKHNESYTDFRKYAAATANNMIYRKTGDSLASFVDPRAWHRLLENTITCPVCRGRVSRYFARAFRKNGFDLVIFAAKRNSEQR